MIGNYIIGKEVATGQPVEGVVLDKVQTVQTMQMQRSVNPQQIGAPPASMPVLVDTYFIINPDLKSLHLVMPQHVMSVAIQEPERLDAAELNDIIKMISEENQQLREVIYYSTGKSFEDLSSDMKKAKLGMIDKIRDAGCK